MVVVVVVVVVVVSNSSSSGSSNSSSSSSSILVVVVVVVAVGVFFTISGRGGDCFNISVNESLQNYFYLSLLFFFTILELAGSAAIQTT